MPFRDFLVQIHSIRDGRFRATLRDQAGDAAASFSREELPIECSLTEGSTGSYYRDVSQATAQVQGNLQRIGARLYEVVFQKTLQRVFEDALREERKGGLRLKIFLDPEDPEIRFLQGIPWELMWTSRMALNFLALSDKVCIVRSLPVEQPALDAVLPHPFRVLVVQADPLGISPLDLKRELEEIEGTSRTKGLEVKACQGRLSDLEAALDKNRPVHVLHFMGHGSFGEDQRLGHLIFEDSSGNIDRVDGFTFVEKLRRSRKDLQMIVLNACKTAQESSTGPAFSSVASVLVQAGFPAIIAMQNVISDQAAIAFSKKLYEELALGKSREFALTQARQAVLSRKDIRPQWFIPSLFLRAAPVQDTVNQLVNEGLNLFRSGNYPSASQKFLKVLSYNSEHPSARLYGILSRLAAKIVVLPSAMLKIDAELQQFLNAADPEIARIARLSLGIFRLDSVVPQGLRVSGVRSGDVFSALKNSRRTSLEKEIACALGASRDALILFNLQD